jgi:carboxylesterase type B
MRWSRALSQGLALATSVSANSTKPPTAFDVKHNVTYTGLKRNGIDVFLGVHFGQDTGGQRRFKPPQLARPAPGSRVNATAYGPACPQTPGLAFPPLILTDVTDVSEDCLHLNIARPSGTKPGDDLPVLVWIHGGSFWLGQNREITTMPDALILESVANDLPIIHVAVQYRLGREFSAPKFLAADDRLT